MQQTPERNARSGARPMLWLTLAFHLGLAVYLYSQTSTKSTTNDQTNDPHRMEQTAKP